MGVYVNRLNDVDALVAMHDGEMPEVNRVFCGFLRMVSEREGVRYQRSPAFFLKFGRCPDWRTVTVPNVDGTVRFMDVPGVGDEPFRRGGSVSRGHAGAGGVEAEAVERAADGLALNPAAHTEVRAEMRAMSVLDIGCA